MDYSLSYDTIKPKGLIIKPKGVVSLPNLHSYRNKVIDSSFDHKNNSNSKRKKSLATDFHTINAIKLSSPAKRTAKLVENNFKKLTELNQIEL